MHSTYPSLGQLADQLSKAPEYAQLRTYIRGTMNMALVGSKKLNEGKEPLSDRECVSHSLIAKWLDSKGYNIAAQMMRSQMSEEYVENPEKYLIGTENIDSFLKNLKTDISEKIVRNPKPIENGGPFPKVNPIELRREPIKVTPLSEEEIQRTKRQRAEIQRARLARLKVAQEIADSVESSSESSDSSDDSLSSSESSDSPNESKSSEEVEEEKLTFADILGKSGKPEESEVLEVSGGLSFLRNSKPTMKSDSSKTWGPSKLGLVTDDVATTSSESAPSSSLPSLFSPAHLPPLTTNRPILKSTKSEEIDALFGDEDMYDLDDFDDNDEEEKEEKNIVESKKEEMKTVEKPVNVVPPVQKKEEKKSEVVQQIEPLVLSDGESIDELEDFDTGLLSSGGSDYSF
ncbi:hypothetical protein GCK72_001328 [Caenorhabditis remanei]|uniref:LisH domain-containing protein n=1 Tax=Caenorhabditis remanei TaxID=31234 RepID=A0A6A5HQK3_CAERE|nr:hypothetical protein GCK72_001328 [Caenorhabditis remanei]KAF1769511.1 hypothetical protein GCK72_001328 [Caenorhabditis remanei]